MAATIDRLTARSVGTASTTLLASDGSASGPANAKVWNLPRVYLTNRLTASIEVDLLLDDGANDTYICEGFPLAAKGEQAATLILEDITLVNGDSIKIRSNTAASLDGYASVLEEDA